MNVLLVSFDTAIYPIEAVRRAAFRYTTAHHVIVRLEESLAIVELKTKSGAAVPSVVCDDLRNEVLDETLRAQIRSETAQLHLDLVRAALQGSLGTVKLPE